jgi:hypothetical protein
VLALRGAANLLGDKRGTPDWLHRPGADLAIDRPLWFVLLGLWGVPLLLLTGAYGGTDVGDVAVVDVGDEVAQWERPDNQLARRGGENLGLIG